MKKFFLLFLLLFINSILSFAQPPFISEISYVGTTLQEIEITGIAGTNVSGWKFEFSGGTNRNVYHTLTIPASNIIDDEGSGYGALTFLVSVDILDTANSGVAFVDCTSTCSLVSGQFLSWGGSFDGKSAASGVTSTNIGVTQSSSANSLQLTNSGWILGTGRSFGTLNVNLTLSVVKNEIENFVMYPNPVSSGKLYISSSSWADKQLEISSITGQRVFNKLLKHKEIIDITNFNKGIYFVKIVEEGKIATRKLVVN